jgi:NAD(P)H-flavin reductase
MGGIASSEHVRQYATAGADLFGVGSVLTGLDSGEMRQYLAELQLDARRCSCESLLPMEYVKTRISSRVDYDATLCKLVLESLPRDYSDGMLAGKFFFLWIPGAGEKPFAIFSASEKSVVVRVVGAFSRKLAELAEGSEILLRGPYGRVLPRFEDSTLVFVGGGTGIASLLEIAHQMKGNRQTFLLGARTRAHLFDVEKFARLGPAHLATDDGSLGYHGYVPDLLKEVIAGIPAAERQRLAFINCGPEAMVRKCFDIQREVVPEDRIIGSIEYMTSCGVGICGKCASPSGALTCIDGPFLPCREFHYRGRPAT